MVKIITSELGSKYLVKSWRPKCCTSRIVEERGTTKGAFTVFLPNHREARRFNQTIGKGYNFYGLVMPKNDGTEQLPILYKASIIYYTGKDERREFYRRLREQRYFLERNNVSKVIKRYG